MVTLMHGSREITIPDWVVDVESFRKWMDADDIPEEGRICFLEGQVWIDMSKEQLFTHGQVKTEFAIGLGTLIKVGKLGRYWVDGPLLSNEEAEISVKPDGVFISTRNRQSKQVVLLEGMGEGHVEIEGAPDMVLEVVSASSVRKDTVVLREGYWKAGIREYWLVDARKSPPSFDILRHTARGYVASRKQDGWVRSSVLGKSFRLTQGTDPDGDPTYTLEVR